MPTATDIKDTALSLLLQVGARLPLPLLRACAGIVGHIAWMVWRSRARSNVRVNLRAAYPDISAEERRRLGRRSFLHTYMGLLELGRVWLREPLPALTDIRGVVGRSLFDEAIRDPRGLLILSPHLGNWELLGQYLTQYRPLLTLYDAPRWPALDAWMQRGRRRQGADIVPIGAAGIRRMLKTLRAGGMVGILPDQVPGRAAAGCNVPFMEVRCYTPTLPLELLRRSGANALFCFARRVRGGYTLHFQAPEPALFSDDDDVAACALNRGVENCVAVAPEQYQWTYKRFRERPRQRPDRYDRMDT